MSKDFYRSVMCYVLCFVLSQGSVARPNRQMHTKQPKTHAKMKSKLIEFNDT